MIDLHNTLYVTTENAYLTLDGENVVVKCEGKEAARYPLHTLQGIVSFSYAGASPALMGACAERNIGLSFFTPGGKFLAWVSGGQAAMCCCAAPSTARPTISFSASA